jgi:hypothetical protein
MDNVQNKIMFKDTFRLADRWEFQKRAGGVGVVEIQATCIFLWRRNICGRLGKLFSLSLSCRWVTNPKNSEPTNRNFTFPPEQRPFQPYLCFCVYFMMLY